MDRPYDVHVGRDVIGEIPNTVDSSVSRIAILFAPAVKHIANQIAQSLSQEILLIELQDSEKAKSFDS